MRARGFVAAAALLCACGGSMQSAPKTAVGPLRDDGRGSSDGEVVGKWLLAETFAPGGDAKQAAQARKRLAEIRHDGMYGSLARGVDAEVHGAPMPAAEGYIDALKAARASRDPEAPLVAWYAGHHL